MNLSFETETGLQRNQNPISLEITKHPLKRQVKHWDYWLSCRSLVVLETDKENNCNIVQAETLDSVPVMCYVLNNFQSSEQV